MRFDTYVRVSRVGGREGPSFASPEQQEQRARSWADAMGHHIEAVHTDLDRSGGTFDRPGIQEAIRRIEAGEVDGVVVADLDRFGRSAIETHENLERIAKAGGTFVAVRQGIDTSEQGGWASNFILSIFAAIAQMERERTAENWNAARQRAIGRGVHLRAPFGYDSGPDGVLVPNDNAPYVREVFRRRAAGMSWGELAAYLNDAGIPSATGAKWQTATIKHLTKVEAYTGVAHHGEYRNEGAHPAIVTRAEFVAAQSVRRRSPSKATDGGPLLSGLIRCQACRYTASRRWSHSGRGRRGKDGRQLGWERVAMYRCKVHHGGGRCPEPVSIMAHNVDRFVEAAFLARVRDEATRVTANAADLDEAQRAYDDADAELRAFASDTTARRLLGDRYHDALQARVAAVDSAKAHLARLAREHGGADLRGVVDVWDDLDVPERRRVLSSAIDAVWLRRDGQAPVERRVVISWRGDGTAPDDLPGRGMKAVPLKAFPWPHGDGESGVPLAEDLSERTANAG